MNAFSVAFGEDIILDDAAFALAVADFKTLSTQLNNLNQAIDQMLLDLQSGFDTPAGRKFAQACREHLQTPMRDQQAVLAHISQTLDEVCLLYQRVFDEYSALNNRIATYNHKL